MNFIPHMRLPTVSDHFSCCLITVAFSRKLSFHDPKNYNYNYYQEIIFISNNSKMLCLDKLTLGSNSHKLYKATRHFYQAKTHS